VLGGCLPGGRSSVVGWGFMPCVGEFHVFLKGGVLMWVYFGLSIIKLKYVGCECVGYLWVA
jgi:hypothetical protein